MAALMNMWRPFSAAPQRGRSSRSRPGPAARVRRAVLRRPGLAASVVLVTAVLGAHALGLFEQVREEALSVANRAAVDAGIVVEDISVSGLRRTSEQDVRAALSIEAGEPLLEIDMAEARKRIENLPWVKTARITRRLPGDLLIDVAEREPYALWQIDGHLWLIDAEGATITDENLVSWRGLPLVVGEGAAEQALDLLTMLEREPALASRVKAAVRVGQRRWDIRFDNGVNLMLPEQGESYGPLAAWLRLAALQRGQAILEREILSLDLRLPDRLIVRVTPEGEDAMEEENRRT